MASYQLDPQARIYIAGHHGMVGSAIWREFQSRGFTNLIGRTSKELDLRDRTAVFEFFAATQPEIVILAAARVGGILANSTYPSEFISDNLLIQVNVMDAAAKSGVERLLFLGSSCIYPKFAAQPISEDSLLTGPLEPTNDAYAIAKIAGIIHTQALRREYGLPYISAMPTNMYGPGDNFDLATAHVLPALLRRFDEAKREGAAAVTIWGTGSPRREFMHVDDFARACLYLLESYDAPEPINVGTGSDVSIAELAQLIRGVVQFDGVIEHDLSKPDGTPQKLLDVSRLADLGWTSTIDLEEGLARTYEWYQSHHDSDSLRTDEVIIRERS